jgi:Ser-tRNA(Ala) deacylase AlaX
MTIKVFWQDPYQTALDTTISSVSGNQVTVSSTIFYAFSGGQSDAGSIAGFPVLEARQEATLCSPT